MLSSVGWAKGAVAWLLRALELDAMGVGSARSARGAGSANETRGGRCQELLTLTVRVEILGEEVGGIHAVAREGCK